MNGFLNFIREQGVVGLAVGFILGGAVSKVVTALITDIVNPLLGIVLGVVGDFKSAYILVGSSKVMWGDFLSALVDFLVVAAVVYFGVVLLRINRLDKKKE